MTTRIGDCYLQLLQRLAVAGICQNPQFVGLYKVLVGRNCREQARPFTVIDRFQKLVGVGIGVVAIMQVGATSSLSGRPRFCYQEFRVRNDGSRAQPDLRSKSICENNPSGRLPSISYHEPAFPTRLYGPFRARVYRGSPFRWSCRCRVRARGIEQCIIRGRIRVAIHPLGRNRRRRCK